MAIDKPFWIGKHEVTQEQWEAVMGNNPSRFRGAENPVETVSWNHLQGFLQKLNAGQGGRFALPTEAQWEYACRAGTSSRFCFGDEDGPLGQYAWYNQNFQGSTHSVGQRTANAWGLHDLHGNVWEWCASSYQDRYDGSEQKGAEAGSYRQVLRGGSWLNGPGNCRSADRLRLGPVNKVGHVGFRVIRSARASE